MSHTHTHTPVLRSVWNEELERSIRSTNYCHSLLREERSRSGGWNSGLREDSCWWNDNNSWKNYFSFSCSPSIPHSHSFFLSLSASSQAFSIVFFHLSLLPFAEPEPKPLSPHHLFFSPLSSLSFSLIYFNLSCFALLPRRKKRVGREGWIEEESVWGKEKKSSEERWVKKKLVSPLSPHNETFRCGRSYASELMDRVEGGKEKEGGERGPGSRTTSP